MPTLTPNEARDLIHVALTGSGLAQSRAGYFTDAILDTELSGLEGHGFYWLDYYCQHLRSGKVDGQAVPQITEISPVSFRVDARHGFAHPAIEAGFTRLIPAAKAQGIAAMGVFNSYNAATLGFHTGTLARAGLFALGATNAVPTVAPVGGSKPLIGTNPISYAVPAPGGKIAFLVDQSATAVAWTAVKRAADAGRPIPLGWALDAAGQPTTDAAAGLAGSMGSPLACWSRCCAPLLPVGSLGRIRGHSPTMTASQSTTASSSSPLIRRHFLVAVLTERSNG
jgi:(2R)-3-sulfolactate dehydrogenase (NADP+)